MKTILLVEDEPLDVMLLQRSFQKLNLPAQLMVVSDGQKAIDYLSGEGEYADRALHPLPLVILLDLKLPRKSGVDVLRWIRAHGQLRYIPVVVLTSSILMQDRASAYEAGANSYLVKSPNQVHLNRMADVFQQYWLDFNQVAFHSN